MVELEDEEVLDMSYSIILLDRVWHMDKLIQNRVNEIHTPGWDVFFQLITQLGSFYAFILLGSLVFLYLWLRGHIKYGIMINGGLAAGWFIMKMMKDMVGRQRPAGEQLTVASGMSFPSGHAMLSLVFYGFIAYLLFRNTRNWYGKLAGYILMMIIVLIGFSRIYLNVHYASDVAAGFFLGSVLLLLMIKLSAKKALPDKGNEA
jgi:undecaprenyl-diphosphatase